MSGEPALMSRSRLRKRSPARNFPRARSRSPVSTGSRNGSRASTPSWRSRRRRHSPPLTPPMRRWPRAKISGVLHGVPMAHKDMYYDAGKVVTCGSKIRRDFVRDDNFHRIAAAEGRRHCPARLAADGGVRLRPDRSQRPLRRGAQPLERRSHHRRLVVRLRLGRGGPADLCGAGLRYRRLDPDARAFLRRHRLQDHGRPDQPGRRDAAVAVARYGRAAGANGRRLRAAGRADGGRRS